jgi:hypothetical protein
MVLVELTLLNQQPPAAEILNFRTGAFDGQLPRTIQPFVAHDSNYRSGRLTAVAYSFMNVGSQG